MLLLEQLWLLLLTCLLKYEFESLETINHRTVTGLESVRIGSAVPGHFGPIFFYKITFLGSFFESGQLLDNFDLNSTPYFTV